MMSWRFNIRQQEKCQDIAGYIYINLQLDQTSLKMRQGAKYIHQPTNRIHKLNAAYHVARRNTYLGPKHLKYHLATFQPDQMKHASILASLSNS